MTSGTVRLVFSVLLAPLFFFLLVMLITPPAQAGARCYSPAEVQAEKLLRLHSELMVITVTCKMGSTGQDLVGAYTGFTKNNINDLHDAEQTMIAYYKKAYGGKGVEKLDRLRTLLANEYGQEIANLSAPVFCGKKRDKVLALYKADSGLMYGEAMAISARSYDPPCGSLKDVASKAR
jgi:hypothetical protein